MLQRRIALIVHAHISRSIHWIEHYRIIDGGITNAIAVAQSASADARGPHRAGA